MTPGSVGAALADAAARLAAAGVPGAARDARLLMAEALGVPPDRLTLAAAEAMPGPAREVFGRLVAERARCRPVAQLLGRRAFWGRDFAVTADVLDPRPETEVLVARALDGAPAARLLDLGTGSGAIVVTLLAEWPAARGLGTDIDPRALAVAAANAERHGVGQRLALRAGCWLDAVDGIYDLVVSNPPYLAEAEVAGLAPDVRDWEPRHALTPGPTGLESYRSIAAGLARVLAPGGRALFEIGAGQAGAVTSLFRAAGFAPVAVHADLDGRDRVVAVGPRPDIN